MKVHLQSLFVGFVAGAATMALVPVLVPAVREVARPVSKVFYKHSLLGLEKLRSTVARLSESIEDLAAEVRAEVDAQLAKKAARSASEPIRATTVPTSRSMVS
jgi:hypothetical protein